MKKYILGLALSTLFIPNAFGVFRFADDSDIPDWAYPSVQMVRETGIMQGFPDGTFGARKTINRAEALVILFRTQGIDFEETQNFPEKFTDIPADAWFTKAVYKAVERGWIKGFPDNTFRPERELNRAEWATLVKRAFDMTPDPEKIPEFSDVPENEWFTDSVRVFYKNELIRHPQSSHFLPGESVSRGEAAWTIAEILQKPRLMGTSKTNDFSDKVQINSRDVAIKPRDFNPDKQGVESTRKELDVTVERDDFPRKMTATSDWTSIGNLRLRNNFEERVQLNSLEFALRFDQSGTGPSREFLLKLTGPRFEQIQEFSRSNTSFISGINMTFQPYEEKVFKLRIKPKDDASFYTKSGMASVSVERAEAITISSFTAEEDERTQQNSRTNLKDTPIKFVSRLFTDIDFDPYPEQ